MMDQKREEIEHFWQTYLSSQPEGVNPESFRYTAWGFGNTPQMADELGALVLQGVKTATCGLLWGMEADRTSIPKAGELSIILNGSGEPLCIIQTTGVEIRPYQEVEPAFAWEEGEGDRSLSYWREVHWRFFSPICIHLGREPVQDMLLVCERFRRVFP
jgi:uncharacterized protein YhfF